MGNWQTGIWGIYGGLLGASFPDSGRAITITRNGQGAEEESVLNCSVSEVGREMTPLERKQLELRLSKESYAVIEEELHSLRSEDLVVLLDSKSRKIGNSAAAGLHIREEGPMLIDALRADRVRTVIGRVRATNLLNWYGRKFPESCEAHVHCLNDRSDDVVSNALFGIVFMRRRDLLPVLRNQLSRVEVGSRRRTRIQNAISALEADDPSMCSPHFRDANNVWRLNEPL